MRVKSDDVLEKLHLYYYWITCLWYYRFTLELSYSTLYLPKVEMDQEYPNNSYRNCCGKSVEVWLYVYIDLDIESFKQMFDTLKTSSLII